MRISKFTWLYLGILSISLGNASWAQEDADVELSDDYSVVARRSSTMADDRNIETVDSLACGGDDGSCLNTTWFATADALLLHRSSPSDSLLAFNTADPAQNLNASDFDFGVHTGVDVSLLRQFACDRSLEVRYFGVDYWRDTVGATTTPGDLFQINTAVPIFTLAGSSIDANYTSSLHNFEVNVRQQIDDRWTLLAGFRYAELDEGLSATLVGAAVPFNYDTTTRNRMYGFQVGGEGRLWHHHNFSLDAIGKAGVFGNAAAQDSVVRTGVVTLPVNGSSAHTAFIGEVGAIGAFQLTEHLALRGGYRLLWIDGVALASDQVTVSDFASGTGFSSSGSVFYHGAFAGIELAY